MSIINFKYSGQRSGKLFHLTRLAVAKVV